MKDKKVLFEISKNCPPSFRKWGKVILPTLPTENYMIVVSENKSDMFIKKYIDYII
jgi:hypothetical protein